MAKIQIKYLTKPNDEIKDYLKSFNPNDDLSDEIAMFLDDDKNFGLMLYSFGKLSGFILLSNNEEKRNLLVNSAYFKEYYLFGEVLKFLKNKFKYYKLIIKSPIKDGQLKVEVKKAHAIAKDGFFEVTL